MQIRKFNPLKLWQNISVRYKIYNLVGVMGLLVATELATLSFAMNTLSSVRAFVHGEGLWSKAQKDAVLSLKEYAQTREAHHYSDFLNYIQVNLGDRQARLEMSKKDYDLDIVREGFLAGRIHHEDINGLINLVRRFGHVYHLNRALMVWQQADEKMDELLLCGENLHRAVLRSDEVRIKEGANKINFLNAELTELEDKFSSILGEGSRWLEKVLFISLFFAVLIVECTGLLMTVSFGRQLSGGLRELNHITDKIGEGDFTLKAAVNSGDELGKLAAAINKMSEALATSLNEQRRAELASQTKSQFLANMSHEIRTPVAAIVGFVDLLKEPDISQIDQKNYIEVIRRTGLALTKIIDDILDLSKVEAGYFDVEKSAFSLPTLIKDVETLIQRKCVPKSIKLVIRAVGDVPEFISTDPLRLKQILINVLGNASKFTEHGHIVMSYHAENGQLVFDVEDNGIGIAPDQISLLFQPFSQVDSSSTRRHDGTGLGLVLSRRLANLLGGDVELIRSELAVGSLFRIKIAFDPADAPVDVATSKVLKSSKVGQLTGKKVLVVDDNEDNRFLLNRILSKHGATVTEARHGLEGVAQALDHRFDAIILDIQMPVMDGYTVARKLREEGLTLPIIALTAHAMKEDRTKCLAAGCNAYLTKPIQVDQLVKVLLSQMDVNGFHGPEPRDVTL